MLICLFIEYDSEITCKLKIPMYKYIKMKMFK